MKVAINARAFKNRGGIGRYSRALVRTLIANYPSHEFLLLAHPGLDISFLKPASNWHFIPIPGPSNRAYWETYSLPPVVNKHQPDIFHNPDYTVPAGIKVPSTVTVHDLSFKYFQHGLSLKARVIYGLLTPPSVKKCRIIMADSAFTKAEIVRAGWKDEDSIRIIHLAVDKELFQPPAEDDVDEVLRDHSLEPGYILYLGAIDKRKNIVALVKAYAELKKKLPDAPRLVLAGENIGGEAEVMNSILNLGIGDSVVRIGFVQPDHLCELYAGASVFVFPSLYEGFGLPPLEAMACGVPVITSNAASLPEVVGDAGITVSLDDPDSLTDAMHLVLTDSNTHAQMADKGRVHAGNFTWDKVAANVMSVYEETTGSQ